jgi:hypothetical protein
MTPEVGLYSQRGSTLLQKKPDQVNSRQDLPSATCPTCRPVLHWSRGSLGRHILAASSSCTDLTPVTVSKAVSFCMCQQDGDRCPSTNKPTNTMLWARARCALPSVRRRCRCSACSVPLVPAHIFAMLDVDEQDAQLKSTLKDHPAGRAPPQTARLEC